MLAVLIATALRGPPGVPDLALYSPFELRLPGRGVHHGVAIGSAVRSAAWAVTIVAACIGAIGGRLVPEPSPRTPTSQVG